MHKFAPLLASLALAGSVLAGGIAHADDRNDRRPDDRKDEKKGPVEARGHGDEPVRHDVRGDRDDRDVRDHRDVRDGRGGERANARVEPVARRPVAAPPRAPVERGGRIRGYVWLPGEYQFLEGQYVFIPGHHAPARAGYHWVAGSWARHGHEFVRIPGRWVR